MNQASMSVFLLTLMTLMSLLALSEGKKIRQPRHIKIIGGQNANIADYSYIVQIKIKLDDGTKRFCGGTLVTKNKVLTSAHCKMRVNDKVVFGTDQRDRDNDGYVSRIQKVKRHPMYNGNSKVNDIAVLTLSDDVHGIAKPIELIGTTDEVDGRLTILGWGRTSYPNGVAAAHLQRVSVPKIGLGECESLLPGYPVSSSNICTNTYTTPHQGTCVGDSGGPVVIENCAQPQKLVGIISFGVPCATGKPDVHTSIQYYHDWIIQNIQDEGHTELEGRLKSKSYGKRRVRKFNKKNKQTK